MTKIIVKNNTTDKTYIYDRKDILKARMAVDYLSLNTPTSGILRLSRSNP